MQLKGNSSSTVSVLNLSEVVVDKVDPSSITNGSALSYFHALCRQPVPGPLVGGSAASKDVNKWLDEMIAWYESSSSEFQRGDTRKLLISLLKILSQHYGKLRSPFASDPSQEVLPLILYSVIELFVYISPLFSLVCFPLLSSLIFTACIRKHCVMVICFEFDGVNQNISWMSY